VGIGAGITEVIRLFGAMREAREEAMATWGEAEGGLARLSQLAESKKEYRALTARARNVFGMGGADSLEAAAKLVFQVESASASKYESLFAQLRSAQVIEDPAVMAKAMNTLQKTMGKRETGTMRALASKAFGASKFAPSAADELLEAAARSGTSAAALGMTDEEILAAVAIVSEGKGGHEQGGTYLAQMMRTLRQKGIFKGRSLRTALGDVQRITGGMTEEDAKTWFGRAQGREAFDILQTNLPRYDAALAEVLEAQRTDRVALKLSLPGTDPAVYAARQARIAEAKEVLAKEELGSIGNIAEKVQTEFRTEARKSGWSNMAIELADRYQSLRRNWFGDRYFLEQVRGDVQSAESRADIETAIGPEYSYREGARSTRHAPRDARMSPELMQGLRDELRDAVVEGLRTGATEALKDGARGPTLVPPNVDR